MACNILRNQDGTNSIIDSKGNPLQVEINDKPFTAICDWIDDCDYKCNPEITEFKDIDITTYDSFSANWYSNRIKMAIANEFKDVSYINANVLINKLNQNIFWSHPNLF
jgi:hypothetical protein